MALLLRCRSALAAARRSLQRPSLLRASLSLHSKFSAAGLSAPIVQRVVEEWASLWKGMHGVLTGGNAIRGSAYATASAEPGNEKPEGERGSTRPSSTRPGFFHVGDEKPKGDGTEVLCGVGANRKSGMRFASAKETCRL